LKFFIWDVYTSGFLANTQAFDVPHELGDAMKYRHIWNGLLVVASVYICVKSAPLIVAQAKGSLPIFGGSLHSLFEITWLLSHIGLPVAWVLFLMSLGSWTWGVVGPKMWWFYVIATALMIIGAGVCLVLAYIERPLFLTVDYIKFAVAAVAISFPIVVLKTGWIGLAIKLLGGRK
jgi:hypothetical protein